MRHALYPQGAAVYATDQNIIKFAAPMFHNEGRADPPFSKQRDALLKPVQLSASKSDSVTSNAQPLPAETAVES